MLRYFVILIFLAASVTLFFTFIDPLYKEVKITQGQIVQLDEALSDSRKIQDIRDSLLARSNSIALDDLEKIKKVLPDHVDNIRLILEINRIAGERNLVIQSVRVGSAPVLKQSALGPDERLYGTSGLDVTVAGSYRSFINFLTDLERGLRIVDVKSVSFSGTPADFSQYTISLTTYWLR